MEKGKELAASVDKKLTEAVGVELHGGASIGTSATTSTSSNSTDLPPQQHHSTDITPSSVHQQHHEVNDAWNDDFDDDSAADKGVSHHDSQNTNHVPDINDFRMDSDIHQNDNHQQMLLDLDSHPHATSSEQHTHPMVNDDHVQYDHGAGEKQHHQQQQEEDLMIHEEEGGWNGHHDDEQIEELDLNHDTSAALSSAIPVVALPNPIHALSSILSSTAALTTTTTSPSEEYLDYHHQSGSQAEAESMPHEMENQDTAAVVDEPTTPPEAAWEDDLYASEDVEDEVIQEPPKSVEQEPVVANFELSETPSAVTAAEPVQTPISPPPPSNGDKSHALDARQEEELSRLKEDHQMEMVVLQSKLEEVQHQLHLREQQLEQRAAQFSELEAMHETEREELRKKIHETKEEAKKRIQKAKERVASMEERLNVALKSANDDAGSQHELVAALRAEGESLARKQSEMEKAVRAAKGEARELREALNGEVDAKDKALEKIANLEVELKTTKESLSAARKGESQAGKLESELAQAREDCNAKATTILSLEQQIKELKAETKELRTEVESSKRGATIETEREMAKLRKEHNEVIADLELKLRTSEREAGVREDALRHEVAELRKRWQDAVRRADGTFILSIMFILQDMKVVICQTCILSPLDCCSAAYCIIALSMDVQSSTAPLLRQLESMERQNRARASAWADLEGKLRAELEDHVIQNEQLSKERNELKTKHTRLERISKEREEELTAAKATIEELTIKMERLERKLATMEEEGAKLKEEWAEVERLANEGVARVRSEMTQTVVESETRYRSQIDSMEEELKIEKEKRRQLEQQVEELLASAGMIGSALSQGNAHFIRKESKPRKLLKAEGQADILAGALNGLDGEEDDEAGNPADDEDDDDNDEAGEQAGSGNGISSSFAAMEQLNQRLTGARYELESLRKRLAESEKSREALLEELGDSRLAKEKLPLFEAKIKELTEQNLEKELEIQGLREDIAEVRELYRNQLNVLLEEKAAANNAVGRNDDSTPADTKESVLTLDEPPPSEPVQS